MQTNHCRSCGARITWAVTKAGRNMPVDVEPHPAGNLELTPREDGAPLVAMIDPMDAQLTFTANRYRSHFATCPDASSHRRVG